MKIKRMQAATLSIKQFGRMFNLYNFYSAKALYHEYLYLAGKKENMTLTIYDVRKIDGDVH